ncbi:hypothetical protein GCM10023091_05270 [Ravibacter arvi]|uniref:DUF922 domain-containing protein n=1 Tax=Ravibacter arvi TaxID=2051041 RepID=A0ABP8LMR3_9BACT
MGIKSKGAKWSKNLVGFMMFFVGLTGLYGQPAVLVEKLPATKIALREKGMYYLEKVEDARGDDQQTIGRVVVKTRLQPLGLSEELSKISYDFWNYSLDRQKSGRLPVTVRIRKLLFSETRVSPGKVSGNSEIEVQFLGAKSEGLVPLTSFKSKSQYTRPESQTVHDKFLQKMLSDALIYFDKWMTANRERNPVLARGIRLIIEDDNAPPKADTIFYDPKRPLRYDDFKAAPRAGRYAAMVFTSIAYEGASRMNDNMVEVTVRLKVYLVKSMSWMRPESRNPNVLRHEQLHFDIAKISAERFKDKLRQLELSVEDHDSEIQYLFLESYREMHQVQEDYDKETRHGLNGEMQKKWEDKVNAELARRSLAKRE